MSDLTAPETGDPAATARLRGVDIERDRSGVNSARPLALIFGLWAAVASLYWPSTLELHELWTNWSGETYTHGYLVLLLSIWLIVREHKKFALAAVRPEPLALIPLAFISAAWVWFWRAAIQELQLLLLPVILYSALYAALGRRIARALAFPIAFLYFAMPFWGDINGIVQGLSAKVTGVLIWLTGLPAYMAGDVVHLPGGAIEIATSCSGLHTLIVGLALAALYGKISGEPWLRRLAWLGLMGVLSLLVNWIRIFTVIVAAYQSDMRSSLVENHYWLGWWLFAFAFAGFLWWTGHRSPPRDDDPAPAGKQHASDSPPSHAFFSAPALATLAVLGALPALAYGMAWTNLVTGTTVGVQWPAAPTGWAGPSPDGQGEWRPHFINSSGEALARYAGPAGERLEAFAVAYRVQTQRAKLLGYGNDLLGSAGSLRQQSLRLVDSPNGSWQELVVVDSNGSRSLIWLRYRIGNRFFVNPRASQLWYGLVAIVRPPISSLTALRTPCLTDCDTARARLTAATQWVRPVLQ